MAANDKNSMLVIVRRPPYGSSLARTALDVALAAAAFDQPVNLLFMGDGVLQLLPEQDSSAIGIKNIERLLASLPLYEIETVYVDSEAAALHSLDLSTAPLATRAIDGPAMHRLMDSSDHLLGF